MSRRGPRAATGPATQTSRGPTGRLMFTIITAALVPGGIAERARFWPWTPFVGLWTLLVDVPLAHWIFAFDGYVAEAGGWMATTLGAIGFAGGTAVEIDSGASALAPALVLGRRRGWPREPVRPHILPAVLLGAGLLWFRLVRVQRGLGAGGGRGGRQRVRSSPPTR